MSRGHFFRGPVSTTISPHHFPIRGVEALLSAGLSACVVMAYPSAAKAQSRSAIAGGAADPFANVKPAVTTNLDTR
jgi:hypothetical protein